MATLTISTVSSTGTSTSFSSSSDSFFLGSVGGVLSFGWGVEVEVLLLSRSLSGRASSSLILGSEGR